MSFKFLPGTGHIREVITDRARITAYRRAAARINHMSLDNPLLSFASKEVSREMSEPIIEGERAIKIILRFMKGCPGVVYKYPWQSAGLLYLVVLSMTPIRK